MVSQLYTETQTQKRIQFSKNRSYQKQSLPTVATKAFRFVLPFILNIKYPQYKILIPGIKFVEQAYCTRNVSSYTQHILKRMNITFKAI